MCSWYKKRYKLKGIESGLMFKVHFFIYLNCDYLGKALKKVKIGKS